MQRLCLLNVWGSLVRAITQLLSDNGGQVGRSGTQYGNRGWFIDTERTAKI